MEEAPLEARARRQKPRERLKDDATDKEIREDELYRTIERDFRPFDYTLAAYKKLTAEEEQMQMANGQHVVASDEDTGGAQPQPQAITTDEALPASRASNSNSNTSDPRDYNPDHAASQSSDPSRRAPPGRPPPLPPYPNPYTNSARNSNNRPGRHLGHVPSGSIVVGSSTGGVQVRLDGTGNWSELARQDNTLPTDAAVGRLLGEGGAAGADGKDAGGSGGVFGFLSRKKGRGNSPKPKERGVLGKEGARVVIG